jgi:hypothetical protein
LATLDLSSNTYHGNSPIVSLLNLSLLPAVRTIYIRFNVDEHGNLSFVGAERHEMLALSDDVSMQNYDIGLRKRMSLLEHVEVVFATKNERLSDEQKFGYVRSTMFNRVCWQRALLSAFLVQQQDLVDSQTSDWREKINMGAYVHM